MLHVQQKLVATTQDCPEMFNTDVCRTYRKMLIAVILIRERD